MDGNRFDALSRRLARGVTRRDAVTGLAAGLAGALGLRVARDAEAQVSQAFCGNQLCATNPGNCKSGCVCCVYTNALGQVTNSRCRPPGSCSPGTEAGGGTPTTTARPTTTTTTAPPCVGIPTAALQPPPGPQLPPTLNLDATGSSDPCGRPLRYYWTCTPITEACNDFIVAAGGINGGTLATYAFPLEPGDVYAIGLKVCAESSEGMDCSSPVLNNYFGVE